VSLKTQRVSVVNAVPKAHALGIKGKNIADILHREVWVEQCNVCEARTILKAGAFGVVSNSVVGH
jgi:hypothetical protein